MNLLITVEIERPERAIDAEVKRESMRKSQRTNQGRWEEGWMATKRKIAANFRQRHKICDGDDRKKNYNGENDSDTQFTQLTS